MSYTENLFYWREILQKNSSRNKLINLSISKTLQLERFCYFRELNFDVYVRE